MWIHLQNTSHVARMNVSFEACEYMYEISVRHVAHMDEFLKHVDICARYQCVMLHM